MSDLFDSDSNSDTASGTVGSIHINTDQQAPLDTTAYLSFDPASYAERELSDDDKLELLTSTSSAPADFCFPVTSGQRFNPKWLTDRPWLRYSMGKDCIFCISCLCFSALSDSPYVLSGFRNWKKALGMKTGYIDQHTRSENHRLADEKAALFLQTRSKPGTNICAMLSKVVSEQQLRTTKIIDIIYCFRTERHSFQGKKQLRRWQLCLFCQLEIYVSQGSPRPYGACSRKW